MRLRTLCHRLLREAHHGTGPRGIAAFEIAKYTRGIADTLDGEGGRGEQGGEGVEEGRAGEGADIAEFEGAAGEDDGDGAAEVREDIVAGWVEVGEVAGLEGCERCWVGGGEAEEAGEKDCEEHVAWFVVVMTVMMQVENEWSLI